MYTHSLPLRALWSTGEPELMEKCGVHNSIIDCTYVGMYTSVVFTHPERRRRCCVRSRRRRGKGGKRDIILISDVTGERRGENTDVSFTHRKCSQINQLALISHEDLNRAPLFDVLRSDLSQHAGDPFFRRLSLSTRFRRC